MFLTSNEKESEYPDCDIASDQPHDPVRVVDGVQVSHVEDSLQGFYKTGETQGSQEHQADTRPHTQCPNQFCKKKEKKNGSVYFLYYKTLHIKMTKMD